MTSNNINIKISDVKKELVDSLQVVVLKHFHLTFIDPPEKVKAVYFNVLYPQKNVEDIQLAEEALVV